MIENDKTDPQNLKIKSELRQTELQPCYVNREIVIKAASQCLPILYDQILSSSCNTYTEGKMEINIG